MFTKRLALLAWLTIVCLGPTVASGEGWDLWPFNNDKPKSKTTSTSTSLMGGSPLVKSSSEPSLLSKMGTGTKNFFSSTYDTLTFRKSEPKGQVSSSFGGWGQNPPLGQSYNRKSSPKKKKDEPGWFSSLFTSQEEPKRAETVSEWIGQPRPQ